MPWSQAIVRMLVNHPGACNNPHYLISSSQALLPHPFSMSTVWSRVMYSPFNRISIHPRICSGEPCIDGTRVQVSAILDLLACGLTGEQIVDAYPQLILADVRAVVLYRKSILHGLQVVRGKAC